MQEGLKFTQAVHRGKIEAYLTLLKAKAEQLLGLPLKIRHSTSPSGQGFAMVVEEQQTLLKRLNPFNKKRRVVSVVMRYSRNGLEITYISYAPMYGKHHEELDKLSAEAAKKMIQNVGTCFSYTKEAVLL